MSTKSFSDLLHSLDPRPEVRFREFERICCWFLLNAPEYRSRIGRVWLWSEWPDAWGRDAGIDLIAEERDGGLWAIQAKLYDPAYAIKKSDVDSFLSESARYDFAYRLLIATTDRLGTTARSTLDDQRRPVGYVLRSQLELAPVLWPASAADLRPRRPPRKKPLPHVREAIRATVKGFADHDRGQLIMACGTGKTLAGLWIAERLGSTRTLVLVPSLSLLAQTLREWSANASDAFEYLAVCSDATVLGEDELVQHTAELGLPCTTSSEAIAAFLRRRGRRVLFATYQSSPQIATAYRERTPAFDLAVADEAHRCAGRVRSDFATILDYERIRARRRLFMTATPRYYTTRLRHEAGLLDVDVASMDDPEVFGPVLHRLTFGDAIKRNLLSDYQVAVVGVDDETYRAWAERGEFVTPDGEKVRDARSLASQIALAKAMRSYDLRRVITFHGRVRAAREFSADAPYVFAWMPGRARPSGTLWSEHVAGTMTSGHRDRLLLRFRGLEPGERALLSNARCLSEGVDVPSIDGIAFIDPRRSTIDIIQAVGRAIRRSPEKKIGTIILPIFVEAQTDPERALEDSSFGNVWGVLKALRAHDDELGEHLDDLRRELGRRGSGPWRPGKIRLDLPVRVGGDFIRAFDVRLVEETTASWHFSYGLLERFVTREGHGRVPQGYLEEDFPLGAWVSGQRQAFKKCVLSIERIRRLEALPGWEWDTEAAAWERGFEKLLQYVSREGHARVARPHREDAHNLGQWVGHLRRDFKRGKLSAAQQARLERLPGWSWDTIDDRWEQAFSHLLRFVAHEGHARVPEGHVEDGFALGQWRGVQRRRRRQGLLSDERQRRLEALPRWTWEAFTDRWDEAFEFLERFVQREGHARVPTAHVEVSFPLGQWTAHQRTAFKRRTLPPERARRLECLPGWNWNAVAGRWDEAYAILTRFVGRHGHALVPTGHAEADFRLGQWVAHQRRDFKAGGLDHERAQRLESLPGWSWNPVAERWEDAYSVLAQFVEREGHARVPREHKEEDFPLGQWVGVQRRAYTKGALSRDRRSRLERLPAWSWASRSHHPSP